MCSGCKENVYVDLKDAVNSFESIVSSFYNDKWITAVENNTWIGVKNVLADDTTVINNIVDRINGETALHIAVRNSNYAMIEFLIDHDADIDYQSQKLGQTPLHIAATKNDVKAIQLLCRYSADEYIKTNDSKIAQDLCNENIKSKFGVITFRKRRPIGWQPDFNKIRHSIRKKKYYTRDFLRDDDIRFNGDTFEHNDIWEQIISNYENNYNGFEIESNANINAKAIQYKRMKFAKHEIESRNYYVTIFGYKCGFEVDEIGLYLDKLSKEAREKLWTLIVQENDSRNIVDKSFNWKYITMIINSIGFKISKRYKRYPPCMDMMQRLAFKFREQFPKESFPMKRLDGSIGTWVRSALRKDDFINGQVAIWLYHIHHSQDWQGEKKKKYLQWEKERIIWIGFYNNDDNEKCLIRLLPKDIVFSILQFLGNDHDWTLQQLFACPLDQFSTV